MGATSAGLAVVTALINAEGTHYIGLGTGSTAYAKSQTALVAETAVSGLTRAAGTTTVTTTTDTNDTVQCSKTFTAGGSATIAEVGLFNASSGPTMYGRTVISPTRPLVSGDQYTVVYKFVIGV